MVLGKPQTDPTLEWFLSHCHIHKYPSKSTLIHAGEKAETLYYIVKGSVAVLIKDEEGKVTLSVNLVYSKKTKSVQHGLELSRLVKWRRFRSRSFVNLFKSILIS